MPSLPGYPSQAGFAGPRISVVIPSWNGRRLLEHCLERLALARRWTRQPWEVLVVDNGSDDGTEAWIRDLRRERPWLRCIRLEKNHGFAGGCNAGIREARGSHVLLLNNDTLPGIWMCHEMLRVQRRIPGAGLVGAVSNYVKGRQVVALLENEGPHDLAAIEERLRAEAGPLVEEVEELAGLSLLAPKAFFDEVGGFAEEYGLGNYEDDDLCLRARIAGHRLLIAPGAYCHHLGNKTFEALGDDYRARIESQAEIHDRRWRTRPLYEVERALERGDWNGLEALLEGIAPEGSESAWFERARAHLLEARGRFEEAVRYWEAFLRAHPLHAEGRCHHALSLLQAGREEEGRKAAARLMGEVHLSTLAAASLLSGIARFETRRKRTDEATFYLRKALEVHPGFLPALNLEAVLHLEAGRFEEAERALAPFGDKEDPDVLTNLAIARYRLGKVEEATRLFEKAASLAGPDSPAAANLAALDGRAPPTGSS